MSHMATYDYICSHMATYGFFDFRLIMVTSGNIWYMKSYGHSRQPMRWNHIRPYVALQVRRAGRGGTGEEPYATICELTSPVAVVGPYATIYATLQAGHGGTGEGTVCDHVTLQVGRTLQRVKAYHEYF